MFQISKEPIYNMSFSRLNTEIQFNFCQIVKRLYSVFTDNISNLYEINLGIIVSFIQ